MHDKIKEIRVQLRRAMNGVVSHSMREKGLVYKLNFGVPLPEIKQIAARYEPDEVLAAEMWKEDVRELKILATLLQPLDRLTLDQARCWAGEIPNIEIAGQCSHNLFSKLSFAENLAFLLLSDFDGPYNRLVGFLILSDLCTQSYRLDATTVEYLITEGLKCLEKGLSAEQRAALLALKRFGRQSAEQSQLVLRSMSGLKLSVSPVHQEFYEDMQFEFTYYLGEQS